MLYLHYVKSSIIVATIANSGGYSSVKIFGVNLYEIFGYYFSSTNIKVKKFIHQIVLIGWFHKVVFDIRFADKYKSTGFKIDVEDFLSG